MYPNSEVILDGVIATFIHEIQPELTSGWAQRQAGSLLICLEHLKRRWLYERQAALEERAELMATLSRLLASTADWGEFGTSLRWEPLDALEEEPPCDPGAIVAQTASLRGLLDAVITALPPDDTRLDAVWGDIKTYLGHQADREDLFTSLSVGWVGAPTTRSTGRPAPAARGTRSVDE